MFEKSRELNVTCLLSLSFIVVTLLCTVKLAHAVVHAIGLIAGKNILIFEKGQSIF